MSDDVNALAETVRAGISSTAARKRFDALAALDGLVGAHARQEAVLRKALDHHVVKIAREWIVALANTNSDRELGLGPRLGPVQHQRMLAVAIDDLAGVLASERGSGGQT